MAFFPYFSGRSISPSFCRPGRWTGCGHRSRVDAVPPFALPKTGASLFFTKQENADVYPSAYLCLFLALAGIDFAVQSGILPFWGSKKVNDSLMRIGVFRKKTVYFLFKNTFFGKFSKSLFFGHFPHFKCRFSSNPHEKPLASA